ncbi:PITH domain-containing protein [Trametes pubescens]|uniref:PITH domain-containing protein n=1 Tax=Trametes pubescens TaxID=154538 RepID=A0A1M2V2J2_TRAPU|nr:PITH domain-containing protein [Trametes pubescens]
MAHNHSHGDCHDESNHHDHQHGLPEDIGHRDNLYARIDRANVVALNAEDPEMGPAVIKPWDQRQDEETYLESDADDQLIIRIPFTGAVKLRAILIKAGPADQTPTKVALFPNIDNLDFSEIEDMKPVQEFTIPQGRDVGEYHVMPAKFPNVTSVTLFFPAAQGADTTRIYYIGFLGQWSEVSTYFRALIPSPRSWLTSSARDQRKFEPVVTVYESKPNLADHDKIQGLNENWSAPGT